MRHRLRGLLGVFRNRRVAAWIVVAVLAVDVGFIAYSGAARMLDEARGDDSWLRAEWLLITTDRGAAESFNDLKLVAIAVFMGWLARRTAQPVYTALAVLFACAVADDALELHEGLGAGVAYALDLPRRVWGIRAQDVGELCVWAAVGLVAVPCLFVAIRRSASPHRENGLAVLTAGAPLAFCALVVDQLYHPFHDVTAHAGLVLELLEEGGEMLAATGIFGVALAAFLELRAFAGTTRS